MQVIKKDCDHTWYLVKEWQTEAGLQARVQKCVWSKETKEIASMLPDYFTGYVRPKEGDTTDYYYSPELDVHGGVTFYSELKEGEGKWVGFDMAYIGDENKKEEDAITECESLAKQLATKN